MPIESLLLYSSLFINFCYSYPKVKNYYRILINKYK